MCQGAVTVWHCLGSCISCHLAWGSPGVVAWLPAPWAVAELPRAASFGAVNSFSRGKGKLHECFLPLWPTLHARKDQFYLAALGVLGSCHCRFPLPDAAT